MSFLAPLSLLLGGAAAAAVLALHLLTTRRPPPLALPTARFVPVGEARAVARSSKPTDLLLMALRMLAVLLVGAAFARPMMDAPGPKVRAVVLLERSRAVAAPDEAARLAREALGEGGALVVFGDSARELPVDSIGPGVTASIDSNVSEGRPALSAAGSLSGAFIAARAAAAGIAPGADSVRLVVVSPLTEAAVDAATPALRDTWPGRVELIRVAATPDSAVGERAALVTSLEDDPLAPAVAALGALRGGHAVRIVRGTVSAADSTWARGADRVLIAWPARFEAAASVRGVTAFGAASRPSASSTATVVAPLAALPVPEGTPIARWNDGASAVTQSTLGASCVRHVGIGLPLAGDLTLRAPFARLLASLTEPCGGRAGAAIDDDRLAWLGADAARPLAPARLVAAEDPSRTSRLPALLLAAALLLLAVEHLARRRNEVRA